MSFKLHEDNGTWVVSKDGPNTIILGGTQITFEEYKSLRAKPHEASKRFEKDDKGRIVAKPVKKDA